MNMLEHTDEGAGPTARYYVRVISDDMAPRWRVGEGAMIDTEAPVGAGDDVLVEFASGGRILRRLAAEDASTVTLATYDGRPPTVHDRREIATLHFVCGRFRFREAA